MDAGVSVTIRIKRQAPGREQHPQHADQHERGAHTCGNLGIRIASSADEVEAAQALRYRVFYEEMGAAPRPEVKASRRDFDEFDGAVMPNLEALVEKVVAACLEICPLPAGPPTETLMPAPGAAATFAPTRRAARC